MGSKKKTSKKPSKKTSKKTSKTLSRKSSNKIAKEIDVVIKNSGKNTKLSNWIHQEGKKIKGSVIKDGPIVLFDKIVKIYGKPDIIINNPKGLCIWHIDQKKNDIHHSIELKDEYVPHCVPANHYDFLYSYIHVYIPPNKIKDVLSISGSVGYDGLKKLLYARCASFEANYATLATVFMVLNSKKTKYEDNIKNKENSFEENKIYVNEELLKNQKKYKKLLNLPYYDLAFKNGCPK